jgi:hypothetical protein
MLAERGHVGCSLNGDKSDVDARDESQSDSQRIS